MNLNQTFRQQDREGLLTVDHTASPGIPGMNSFVEVPTYTCSHCQAVVVLNPARKRERTHCMGCNHLICDNCAAIKAQTSVCRTFAQIVDEEMGRAGRQAGSIILP